MRGPAKIMCAMLVAVSAFSARSAASETYIRGLYVGRCPEPVRATFVDAWNLAEHAAAAETKAYVVVGSGPSMEPLYPSGTVLVVKRVPYETLKSGSAVLYYNDEGKPVMHVLVAHTSRGWRVAGLNNPEADPCGVNADNFAGLVVRAFVPKDGSPLGFVRRIAMR